MIFNTENAACELPHQLPSSVRLVALGFSKMGGSRIVPSLLSEIKLWY